MCVCDGRRGMVWQSGGKESWCYYVMCVNACVGCVYMCADGMGLLRLMWV